jgi:hypothetical protein
MDYFTDCPLCICMTKNFAYTDAATLYVGDLPLDVVNESYITSKEGGESTMG